MIITMHNGSTQDIEPISHRLPGEVACIVEYDGKNYWLNDEYHDASPHCRTAALPHCRGNRHRVKLAGVGHWIGAHKIKMVGRVI